MDLIDISHVLDENTPVFPGDYKTSLSVYKTIDEDFYNSYLLQSCLHTGTHIDAPMHLISDDNSMVDFALERFHGQGVLLDVRGERPIGMKSVCMEMIREQDIVLLLTGCDKQWGKDAYFNEHPALSDELGRFLISRNIKMLGMDMPSPDHSPYTLHKELLEAGIFILENLTNLQSLIGVVSFDVMALPLKINAEASFVRAVCVC